MMLKGLNRWSFLPLLFVFSLDAAGAPAGLVEAVKKADQAAVRSLLKQRVDVNSPEPDGTTALHWAVRLDEVDTAGLLIRAGANVKAANRYQVTPLSLACINGNAAMIEMLLKAGADPNTALPEGETALMTAARTGKVDAVKVLLGYGADVNAKERGSGQTALMWAAAEDHAEVIRALLERGADLHARSNSREFTPLLFAARDGRIAAVRALLAAGANVNDALPPSPSVRRRPDPAGASAGAPGTGLTAFLLAAGNAHYELATLLLDAGADPNAAPEGWTALHQVSGVRKPGFASVNDPAPDGSGSMDSLTFVKTLAAHGANLNARATRRPSNIGITGLNVVGATPFLLAARPADAELMRLLAELGADPLLPNEDNTTPLMVAAGVGTSSPGDDPGTEPEALEAVKVALELGGDLNTVDKNGETAMHGAAYKHLPSVVQFLADKGAKIEVWNQKNKFGWTPLAITQGVHRGMNIQSSPTTGAVIQKAMSADRVAPQ